MSFHIEFANNGSTAIAVLEGEIDLANGMHFADELLAKIPDDATALIVDLSELRYIDSAGVRSLFEIASALKMREQSLTLAVPEESLLLSVLKITSVEEVASICSTRDEALAMVSRTPPEA